MLGCGVVDLQAICCLFDCLLTHVYELDQLSSFYRIYGFIAPFGLLVACIFSLIASSSRGGLWFDVAEGRRHL